MPIQGLAQGVEVAGPQRHIVVDEVNDIDRFRQQVDPRVALSRARRRSGVVVVADGKLFIAPALNDLGRALRVIGIAPVYHNH